ncbi:Transforming growth factor-beta receptor-associated protein 1, partial [Aphelenchoides avenae]
MSLELYEVKKCFSVEKPTEGEKITCVTGYSGNLFLGTSTGKVYHYVRADGTWSDRASLEVPENLPILHLVSASALNLLLVQSDSTLFYVDIDGFLITAVGGSKTINCIALNCSPTNDDPYVLQIAIGTRQKHVLLCERRRDRSVELSEKIATDSTVRCVSYSRFAVCFATEQSYYVHNARTKVTHSLFPYDAAVVRPIITNVGVEEFVFNAMQGLAVFVTGDGISQRAPIFMASDDVCSIQYSAPFLYALADKSLKVFSLSDQQMKQSVAAKNAEMMDNIDGWLVVVTADEVDELAPVSIETQIEDALSSRDLRKALTWLNEYATQFGSDARVALKLQRCRQKAAFLALAEGHLDTALDQLVDAEADPRELLALVTDLKPAGFNPDEELRRLLDGKSPALTLDFVERYLRRIRPFAWAKPYVKTIESTLFRIYALTDRMQKLAELDASYWNSEESRAWLLSRERVNLAAEFAFEAGIEGEAMELWRMLATGEKKDDSFLLDSCFERISRLSNKSDLLSALAWLTPLNSTMTFECLQNNSSLTLSDSEAFDVFAEYPELVIRIAEERMQTSP